MESSGQHKACILFVLPNLAVGGAERVIVNLANALTERADVVVCVFQKQGQLAEYLNSEVKLVELSRVTRAPFFFAALAAFFTLPALIAKLDVKCVMPTLSGTNIFVILNRIVWRWSARLVVREACVKPSSGSWMKKWLSRLFYRYADCVIAVSKDVQCEILKFHKVPEDRVKVINNPVNKVEIIRLSRLSPPELDSGKYILALGRLVHQKGFDVLIDAFSRVYDQLQCNLVVVGDGPERDSLVELSRQLHVDDKVLFTGLLHNPYPLLRHAKLLVCSSRWEGFPNVLLEAMVLNRRIVSTLNPGIQRNFAELSRLITFCDCDDSSALGAAMTIALRTNIAACQYVDFLGGYDIENVAHKYLICLTVSTLETDENREP